MRVAVTAPARPTFDVETAQSVAERAVSLLSERHEVSGSSDLVLDHPEPLDLDDVDAVVVLQASFADSSIALSLLGDTSLPVVLWGFPEPRTGGRLKLNSLCGINLGAYALARAGHPYSWAYVDPDEPGAAQVIDAALAGRPGHSRGTPVTTDVAAGRALAEGLTETRVGRVGLPPTGFDPCEAEPELLAALSVAFEERSIDDLFERAATAAASPVAGLAGIEDLDPEGVDRSTRLHAGLRSLAEDGGWDALATRCWPECFTEFGAAACSPQSWLAESGIPAACEADIPGTLSALVLDRAAGRRAFVADLVDVAEDGTMALWHCGNAPVSMAGEEPRATVHPNRGLPLLNEFRIAPGRITIARFTRSKGLTRLVIGGGEVVDEPRPYWGTSAVVRMDRPGEEVLDMVMGEGLDHHFALVHGDVRAEMAGLAEALGLDAVWL